MPEDVVAFVRRSRCVIVCTKVRSIVAYASGEDADLRLKSVAIGHASISIAEAAEAAGMEAIGKIARGIAAMSEKHRITGVLRVEALKLHIDSLALVARGAGGRSRENDLIVAKLAAMRAAICIVE